MPALFPRQTRLVLAAATALALLAGCGALDAGSRVSTALTPYRIEIVQGNFVSKEQVEALHAIGAEIIPDCVVGIHGFWRERRARPGTGGGGRRPPGSATRRRRT